MAGGKDRESGGTVSLVDRAEVMVKAGDVDGRRAGERKGGVEPLVLRFFPVLRVFPVHS
ncbi:MAG: hypothetical protein AAF989_05240 [Planctomycetota bacterium]